MREFETLSTHSKTKIHYLLGEKYRYCHGISKMWLCTELFHNLTPLSVSFCFLLYPLVLTTTIHLLSYSWSCNLLWIICNDLFFFIYNILKVVMYLFNGVQCTTVCIFPPFILKCYTAAVNLEPDALAILTCYSPKNQIWSPF